MARPPLGGATHPKWLEVLKDADMLAQKAEGSPSMRAGRTFTQQLGPGSLNLSCVPLCIEGTGPRAWHEQRIRAKGRRKYRVFHCFHTTAGAAAPAAS